MGEGNSVQQRAQFIKTLRIDDLVLARGCARGHEAAWEQFVALYREKLYRAASFIAREECIARELADSLYADLFGMRVRKDGERVSKLQSYLGRGSLQGWLRTVLAQEYVNRFRRDQRLVPFDEALDSEAQTSSLSSPRSQTTQLSESTDAVLAALSSQERTILAAYYLDGRTLAEIGRMLHAHESTISRRLDKITLKVRKRIVATLRARGFSKRAAEEMLEADVRGLSIDVRNHLAQERQL